MIVMGGGGVKAKVVNGSGLNGDSILKASRFV